MSSASTKIIQAAAGNAGEGLYVEEVFSTYLYEGNGTGQSSSFERPITNNINLEDEGGLVWIKARGSTENHYLFDSERSTYALSSNETSAQSNFGSTGVSSFNSTGFTIGRNDKINGNAEGPFVSWTFRKAPKFFDVVTYTGDGSSNRQIAHNLGCEVGMLVVKRTDGSNPWAVYHRGSDATAPEDKELQLNATDGAVNGYTTWARTAPTSTNFTVGSEGKVNESGWDYVAYLFAHNDGDGEFGEDADQDIIKCGTCSGETGSNRDINLGFEPQFVITKAVDTTGDWRIMDTMRGLLADGTSVALVANASNAEGSDDTLHINSNGFYVNGLPGSGDYIYIAIRRGPMKTPEDADDVFAIDYRHNATPSYTSGFPVDWAMQKRETGTDTRVATRMLGDKYLNANTTGAEATLSTITWDYNDGMESHTSDQTDKWQWMFRRAPGFFDVVAYTGDGVGPRNVPHSLGVVPEMMINKDRTQSGSWFIYHKDLPLDSATQTASLLFDDQPPGGYGAWGEHSGQTATTFEIAPSNDPEGNNKLGNAHITYLFATVPGVSKVGSYTGNGTSQTIDCGFSTGARFVLIKRTDSTSNWNLFDTERGIVAGNDPRLELNTTDAEDTGDDGVDPDSSGFAVNYIATNDDDVNVSGGTYIFLAIA